MDLFIHGMLHMKLVNLKNFNQRKHSFVEIQILYLDAFLWFLKKTWIFLIPLNVFTPMTILMVKSVGLTCRENTIWDLQQPREKTVFLSFYCVGWIVYLSVSYLRLTNQVMTNPKGFFLYRLEWDQKENKALAPIGLGLLVIS